MNKDRGKVIQKSLKRMANFIKEPHTKISLQENRSLCTIAKTINKLEAQELHKHKFFHNNSTNDSLEKVSYYIDLALKTFQNLHGPILNDATHANFIFALSETYETLGDYEAALKYYTVALDLATLLKDQSMQGQINYRMGRIYSEMGYWQKAQDLLIEAIIARQTAGNYSEAALAQIELAKISYRRGEYLKAQEAFQQALETSEQVSDTRNRAFINNSLGIIHRMKCEYDLAYKQFQEALIEFQSIQDFRGAAESLNNLGIVYLWRNELEKAMDCFEKSLQLSQEIGNIPLLPFIYLNKAEFFCKVPDYLMATNMCSRALEYLVKLKNPIGIAKTNMLLGRIFWKSGDWKTGKKFYKESILLYNKFGMPLGLANCYQEYSTMLKARGNSDEAEDFYSKAQEIFNSLNLQIGTD